MDSFELQLLRDARENGGKFAVSGETREDYEAFSIVENGLMKLRDRGAVEWIRTAPNKMNRHSTYRVIHVRITALGNDFLDKEGESDQ